MDQQKFYQLDPWLEPHYGTIAYRHQQYTQQLADITRNYGSLQSFASAHRYFGLHAYYNGWVFREYAPHANEMFLVGTFNNWQPGEDCVITSYSIHYTKLYEGGDLFFVETLYKL